MQKPETITWQGPEWLLHQAALNRGHAEALGDTAANLKRAHDQYKAMLATVPEDATAEKWKEIAGQLADAFGTMGGSFAIQAAESKGKGQAYLGQACAAKSAADAIPRPGWWARVVAWASRRRPAVLGLPHGTPDR